jgi:hypothetical protein
MLALSAIELFARLEFLACGNAISIADYCSPAQVICCHLGNLELGLLPNASLYNLLLFSRKGNLIFSGSKTVTAGRHYESGFCDYANRKFRAGSDL